MQIAFDQWTKGRKINTLGTNAGAEKLPFQTWRHFKEAFAPELVARRSGRVTFLFAPVSILLEAQEQRPWPASF